MTEHLTKREREIVLRLGQSNKQIAAGLSLTEGTVKEYLSNLLRKCGVSNRTALALMFAREITQHANRNSARR